MCCRSIDKLLIPNVYSILRMFFLSRHILTMDRVLRPIRVQYQRRGRATRPGTLLSKQIPIQTIQWDESRPRFLEADTVEADAGCRQKHEAGCFADKGGAGMPPARMMASLRSFIDGTFSVAVILGKRGDVLVDRQNRRGAKVWISAQF